MRLRTLITSTLACGLLAAGCALLGADDTASPQSCAQAPERVARAVAARSRAFDRLAAVTDVNPYRLRAIVAHRRSVQRTVLGPVAKVTTRADRRVQEARDLRRACRRQEAELSERCQVAFDRGLRLAGDYARILHTRMDYWSQELERARGAINEDPATIRAAVGQQGQLYAAYQRQLRRVDRLEARYQRASAACDAGV